MGSGARRALVRRWRAPRSASWRRLPSPPNIDADWQNDGTPTRLSFLQKLPLQTNSRRGPGRHSWPSRDRRWESSLMDAPSGWPSPPASFGTNRPWGTHPDRWKTATFLVALQQPHNGIALARRSDRRERFRSYVEQMLILTLSSPTTSLPGLYLSLKASDPIFASGESK